MKMIINPALSLFENKENIKTAFQEAVADTRHGLRFFSVASFDAVENATQSRMVVLRDFLPDWTFRFYTDYRSSKVAQIQNHPSISLLFWNADGRYQIRIQAMSTIHYKNDISGSEWLHVTGDAQNAYSTVLPPGTVISQPEEARGRNIKGNFFCVIDARAISLKVLQLNSTDHLAAKYERSSLGDSWNGQWIIP